uniref:peptidylprolyl isomerase n=2 Tax=Lepisosteus oculatus TaxID=7918 RepID=W5LY61_LEPOC
MSTNGLSARVQQFLNPEEQQRNSESQSPYRRLARRMQALVGDGGILKEVIHPGVGQLVPENASVSFRYAGFLEYSDSPFESNSYLKHPRLMRLGREVTLVGLEVGLLTMRKGEFARFLFLPDYAYGAMGCPPLIPPAATVLFEVHLLDFLDTAEVDSFFDLTLEQQRTVPLSTALGVVDTERTFGNRCFGQGRYEEAKEHYKKGIAVLGDRQPMGDEEKRSMEALQLPILLNLSLTQLRLERPAKALDYGQKALEISPHNAKALFRCGQAYMEMGEYRKARNCLMMAQEKKPLDTDIKDLLKKLESCHKGYVAECKEMCARMFASLNAASKK